MTAVMIFILANLIPMAIAAAMIVACLSICRAARWIRIPTALVALHEVIVAATVVPSLFGLGGGEFPFDDRYIPFFLYPGPLLNYANTRVAYLVWPWLEGKVGYHQGSYLCIVAIPALLTALTGAIAWMLVGRLLQSAIRKRSSNQVLPGIIAAARLPLDKRDSDGQNAASGG